MKESEIKLVAQVIESLGNAECIEIPSSASKIVDAVHPCHQMRLVKLAETILIFVSELTPDARNSAAIQKAKTILK